MGVMGQVNYLSNPADFREKSKSLFRAIIVETFHDVIGHKRDRAIRLCKLVIAGNPERQV